MPIPEAFLHIKAVTIDVDGTLADLGKRPRGLWTAWLQHRELLSAWRREVETHRGRRSPTLKTDILEGAARSVGMSRAQVEDVLDEVLGQTWTALFRPESVPGPVRRFLEHCAQRGLPVAVVSDHPSLARVERLGLEPPAAIVDCTALGALKPLPDGILTACAQLGCAPAEVLHVGDRWDTDAAAAWAAGCRFLHVDQLSPQGPRPRG